MQIIESARILLFCQNLTKINYHNQAAELSSVLVVAGGLAERERTLSFFRAAQTREVPLHTEPGGVEPAQAKADTRPTQPLACASPLTASHALAGSRLARLRSTPVCLRGNSQERQQPFRI